MAQPDGVFKPIGKNPEPNLGEPKIFLPPNVALHIFFTPHGSKELFGDTGNFWQLVHRAKIVIPENSAWNDEILKMQNEIARGNEKVYRKRKQSIKDDTNPLFVDFINIYYDALYGSNTKVTYVDIQDESMEQEKLEKKLKKYVDFNASINQNLAYLNNILKEIAERQQVREDHMMENLGPRLTEIINPNPNLNKKERVSVLMILGGSHTRIFDVLKDLIKPGPSGLPIVSHEINQSEKIELPHVDLENSYKTGGQGITEQTRQRLASEALACDVIKMVYNVDEIILSRVLKEFSNEELLEVFYSAQISHKKQVVLNSASPIWKKIHNLISTPSQK